MSYIKATPEEREEDRLLYIKERGELNGDPGPGSFGCHEALHAVSIAEALVEREVVGHQSITANPEWFALAYAATEALQELYQAIGSAHLDARDPNEGT